MLKDAIVAKQVASKSIANVSMLVKSVENIANVQTVQIVHEI